MSRILTWLYGFSLGYFVLPLCFSQICDPGHIACTPDGLMGIQDFHNDSITDLTYRVQKKEVWAIEGPLPENGLPVGRIGKLFFGRP